MKVIMQEDVKGKGRKGETKEFPQGFANFLIKNKKAVPATDGNMQRQKEQEQQEAASAIQELENAKVFKAELEQMEVTMKVKAGDGGRVFGAVSSKAIIEAFEVQCSVKLDKRKLIMAEPIKHLGVARVPITLHPDVQATLVVKVEGI